MAAKLSKVLAAVLDWAEAKKKLAEAKPLELKLRLQVIADVFGDLARGTTHHDLGGGRKLQAELSPTGKVVHDKVPAALEQLKATGEIGTRHAEKLFKTEYQLRLGVWNEMTDEQRKLFDGIVQIVDGTPSLSLVEE